MPRRQKFVRLGLAAALLGSLAACTVVPVQPVGYRAAPVYVDTYPTYRYTYPGTYYEYDRRYDDRGGRYYREERRIESPFDSAARAHREIRQSLGLPRLPGMP